MMKAKATDDLLFHKGDVVTVRKDLRLNKGYRMFSGLQCGQTVSIAANDSEKFALAGERVVISGLCKIFLPGFQCYSVEGCKYAWTDEMFEECEMARLGLYISEGASTYTQPDMDRLMEIVGG